MSNITRKEFHEIYKNQFEPILKELEKMRKQCIPSSYGLNKLGYILDSTQKVSNALIFISFIIGILCQICGVDIIPVDSFLIWMFVLFIGTKFVLVTIFLIAIKFCINNHNNFEKLGTLKSKIFPLILQLYGDLNVLDSKDAVTLSMIKDSFGMFKFSCQKIDNDIIGGNYKGIPFIINECEIKSTISKTKNDITITYTDFAGLIIKIKMNKTFKGSTIVGTKNQISALPGFEKIELEDVKFMQNREIYSTDQIEARYLLTPVFMERLEYMESAFQKNSYLKSLTKVMYSNSLEYRIKPVPSAVFHDDYVYLFLPTNLDFFEIPYDETLLNEELYYNIYRQLQLILSLVGYFKLEKNVSI